MIVEAPLASLQEQSTGMQNVLDSGILQDLSNANEMNEWMKVQWFKVRSKTD